MNKSKKYIIRVIIAVLLVIFGATSSLLLLRHINSTENNPDTHTASPARNRIDATKLIQQAEELRAKGDYDGAISSYQKAKELYTSSKDTEQVARIDALLSLLQNEKKQTPVKPTLVEVQ